MSRARLVYADAAPPAAPASGSSVETPQAGWYSHRLVAGGHPVAVKIWFGPPHDPVTGEEMDRHWRWQATANGAPIDIDLVWPRCGREPIAATEAEYLTGLSAWAKQNAPESPAANPHKKIDLLSPATLMPF